MCNICFFLGVALVLQGGCGSSDESRPLLASAEKFTAVHRHAFWEQKLESLLGSEGFVFVVYFARKGEVYSAQYDVRDESVALDYLVGPGHSSLNMIQSMDDFFKFEFLKGVRLKDELDPPAFTKVDFCWRDVGPTTCYKSFFFSEYLTEFLTSFNFPEKGKVSFDGGCHPLTKDVVKSKKPWGKDLLWSVEAKDTFVQSATTCSRTQDEIFVVVPGEGFLCGRWVRRFLWRVSENIFDHKMRLMRYRLRAAYPFDEAKEKWCINFNDKRKSARKSIMSFV